MSPRDQLETLSDEDLKTASNPMALRRAERNVEEMEAPEVEEEDGTLVVRWADETCRFSGPGPSESACSCPARSFCAHRVRSILHLRRGASDDGSDEPAEPPAVDGERLDREVSASIRRRAREVLAAGLTVEWESPRSARFPELDVRVGFTGGDPLEGSVCSCNASPPCLHRIAALLDAPRGVSPEVVELDDDVVSAARRLVERLADWSATGLEGLPDEATGQLEALAQEVETTLPGPADDLEWMASQLRQYRDRSARFSARQWLRASSRLGARLTALLDGEPVSDARADADETLSPVERRRRLVGRGRGIYLETSTLSLIPLGAEGFEGENGRLLRSWFAHPDSESIVCADLGRHGESALDLDGLWSSASLWDGHAPSTLVDAPFELRRAKRSGDGRLTTADDATLRRPSNQPVDPEDHLDKEIVRRAEDLREHWRAHLHEVPPVLRTSDESTIPVVLVADPEEPFAGDPVLEADSQTIEVHLRLAESGEVRLVAPASGEGNATLAGNLERSRAWRHSPTHVSARLEWSPDGWRAHPLGVWFEESNRPISPTFQEISGRKDVEAVESHAPSRRSDTLVEATLDRLLEDLAHLLIAGWARGGRRAEDLRQRAVELRRLELYEVGSAVASLADELDGRGLTRSVPETAVRRVSSLAAWVLELRERYGLLRRGG